MIFKPLLKNSVLLLLALSCQAGDVYSEEQKAEPLTADKVVISTPVYKPDTTKTVFSLGTYEYEISWQGIPAANATVTIDQEALDYKVNTKVRTYSPIDIIYKLRYNAEGKISSLDYSPIKTVIYQKENSREKNTEIEFLNNGEIHSVRSQNNNEPPKVLHFNPNNFTLDPFSAALLARVLDWKVGDTKEFDTFNGKSRYLIKLTATDMIKMKVNDEVKDVFVIEPNVLNLTNNEQSKKLRKAKIYLTADRNREILKIVSSVFIGSVTTELVSYAPDPNASETTMAKMRIDPIDAL